MVSVAQLQEPDERTSALAGASFGALVGLLALALTINQPLLLLPVVLVPYLYRNLLRGSLLVVTPNDLWVLKPDAAPVAITRSDLVLHRDQRRGNLLVTTSHPDYPTLVISELNYPIMARRLRLGDQPTATGDRSAGSTDASAEGRCTLCGDPAAVSGEGSAVGPIICERCGDRTRYEAQQSGRDLAR